MYFQSYMCPNTAIAMDFSTAVQQQLLQKMASTAPGNILSSLHLFQSQHPHLCKTRKDNRVYCTKRATCSYHLYKINTSFLIFRLQSKICHPDKIELSQKIISRFSNLTSQLPIIKETAAIMTYIQAPEDAFHTIRNSSDQFQHFLIFPQSARSKKEVPEQHRAKEKILSQYPLFSQKSQKINQR